MEPSCRNAPLHDNHIPQSQLVQPHSSTEGFFSKLAQLGVEKEMMMATTMTRTHKIAEMIVHGAMAVSF
uniref:Uncharacterized protein n=1 Tax=Arion vulgaris TaxID=1028688 RepID=A0A0B6ZVC8_9EUPU